MESFEAIRRDHRREERSIRQLAARHQVHRRTVRQALESGQPPARQTPQRAAPKMDAAGPLIDAMLREDLDAPRKQRHTARRVLARLVDEHNVSDVSYSTVRDYVARRRPEINLEAGRVMESVFVPQSHTPQGPRARSTSPTCGSTRWGCGPRCSCSRSGCPIPVRRCTAHLVTRLRRRPFWRVTWRGSGFLGVCRRCTCGTTT